MLMRRKTMRGQSAVEFALAAPALALLLVVVSDFGRVFYSAISVTSAAQAGVQYGAQNLTTAVDYNGMQQAALSDGRSIAGLTANASGFCMCSGAVVACSPRGCAEPQIFVQVRTQANFNTLLHYPGIPSQLPLSSTAVLEVQ
jgi:Flp pilus assembly protein TadG